MHRVPLLPFFVLLATLLAAPVSHAIDDESVGVVVYAGGGRLTIIRDETAIRLDPAEALGEPVYTGDLVSTGPGGFAEIQFLTSANIVRVAENTTFVVERVAGGESLLRVTYGRVRARIDRLAGTERFEMRGLSAVGGVRGTDFGYDQIVDPVTGELLDRIYCFDGEVVVSAGTDPASRIVVGEGRMLVVSRATPPDASAVRPIDAAISAFWAARPFVRGPATGAELVREFPPLPARVEERLGYLPAFLMPQASGAVAAAPEPADEPEPPAATPPREAEAEEPEPDVAAPTGEPEAEEAEPMPQGEALAERYVAPSEETVVVPDEQPPEEKLPPELRLARGLRATGLTIAGLGLLADVAAVVLYFYGDGLVPEWRSRNEAVLGPLAVSGVGAVSAGMLTIMFSFGIGE